MKTKTLLSYINPLEFVRASKPLHVNPTLVPERKEEIKPIYTVHEFNESRCENHILSKVEDCFPFIESSSNTWINVDGLKVSEVEVLCQQYNIHPLLVEDILSLGQRPKMEEVNGLVFCVINMLFYNAKNYTVEREQVSMVLGEKFVISFQEDPERDVFKPLRDRLKVSGSKVRQNKVDFLFYTLLDLIVDNYYVVIERLAERIVVLEEDILRKADTRNLARINRLRSEMMIMKQSIAPVRELINGILRSENDLIDERTEKYFKDVYDHIVQANELCENYRDMIMSLQDLYMSMVNLKMNEVMKVMAVVTSLLAPATVIGGIFGMNFDIIPLAHERWGFFIAVGIMLFIPIVMLREFKKRGWF